MRAGWQNEGAHVVMRSLLVLPLCCALFLGGCSWFNGLRSMRSQSPDEEQTTPTTRLVGDLAVPFNLHPVRVEGIGLLTGLRGTGSDPRPSPQRAALVADMQARGVESPNTLLASRNTTMVLVRAYLRPGIQEGDRFDVEVRVPTQSETTSIRGGYLLETRLQEFAVMEDAKIHSGHLLGWAEGPVMVDPAASQKKDSVLLGRGTILGGGRCKKSRPLGLVLTPSGKSVLNAARIETAINKRFHMFQRGLKRGVAEAHTDQYVELAVHPRYKDNIQRYVQVVRAVPLRETESELMDRLAVLEKRLLDPITSAKAALELEAIGSHGNEVLRKGLQSADLEVRFYAAEALAYLDQPDAVEVLARTAREQPAFRVFALTALSAMDNFSAYEELRNLLHVPSAETRYGAFRALWAMNPNDSLVLGENLGGEFSYHVLNTQGPPMIHVTRSRRPEVVLFGPDQRLEGVVAIEAGNQIMVTSNRPGEVAVSRFAVGEADQKRIVTDRIDDVIRAIVELGGTYPDVVQALQEAKAAGALAGRFEVDALPQAGRTYQRVAAARVETEGEEGPKPATSPMPDLFGKAEGGALSQSEGADDEVAQIAPDSIERPRPIRNFFARMAGRDTE